MENSNTKTNKSAKQKKSSRPIVNLRRSGRVRKAVCYREMEESFKYSKAGNKIQLKNASLKVSGSGMFGLNPVARHT